MELTISHYRLLLPSDSLAVNFRYCFRNVIPIATDSLSHIPLSRHKDNSPRLRSLRIFRKAPPIGNSSCFRFEAGASNAVYEFFMREKENPANRHLFAKGSQKLQTRAMFHAGKVNWWPADWVSSFKRQCIPAFPLNLFLAPRPPSKAASIVAFHGHPDIPEAQAGYRFRSRNGTRECVRPHLTSLPAPWIDSLWHE